jgi:hypothetical protein
MIAAAAAWMSAFIRRRGRSLLKAHNAFAVRLLRIGG